MRGFDERGREGVSVKRFVFCRARPFCFNNKKCEIVVEIMTTIIFLQAAGEIQSYFHDSESTSLYELPQTCK